MANNDELFKQIISHAKEYGFIFPSSEIYDGLSAVYDYAQLGVELKNNIKQYWWKAMVQYNENIVGIDSAIFMHPETWKASGHVGAFSDPLIDNKDSKKRYRADVLVEDYIGKLEDKIEKDFSNVKSIDTKVVPNIGEEISLKSGWYKVKRKLINYTQVEGYDLDSSERGGESIYIFV